MSGSFDVEKWALFAQTDYDIAKRLAETHYPTPLAAICFHCQQSAEKILKAYAIAQNEKLIKTHDLNLVLDQCLNYDSRFEDYADACEILAEYAVASRYPSDEELIAEHDMKAALKNALEILKFTKARLAELGYASNESGTAK
jgi:HEPN domain-containing protein